MTSAPSELSQVYSDRYAAISQRLLRQAQEELDSGDLLQASEKVWGAAAHGIKAVAEKWGWYHQGHYRLDAFVRFVAYETGKEDFINLYLHPTAMHFNYYEHDMDSDDVQTALSATAAFVEEIELIRAEPIPVFPSPESLSGPQERRLRLLTTRPRGHRSKPDDISHLPPVEPEPPETR